MATIVTPEAGLPVAGQQILLEVGEALLFRGRRPQTGVLLHVLVQVRPLHGPVVAVWAGEGPSARVQLHVLTQSSLLDRPVVAARAREPLFPRVSLDVLRQGPPLRRPEVAVGAGVALLTWSAKLPFEEVVYPQQ